MQFDELFKLDGKVAAITGGSRHLGYDMAEILAEAGCDLVITSRTAASAEKSAEQLKKQFGRDVLPLALDVSQPAEIEAFAQKAWNWKGRVDILVNNAGGGVGKSPGHLFKRSTEDIIELIAVNLTSSLLCCKAFGPKMAKVGYGKIINIASIAGVCGRDRRMYDRNNMSGQAVEYAAAKSGLIGMTMDLAGLLSPMGIRVNAISPGGFWGKTRTIPRSFVDDYSDHTPLGHMGRDGVDLKGAALYLASPASDYVTGQNLIVDGGFTLWH